MSFINHCLSIIYLSSSIHLCVYLVFLIPVLIKISEGLSKNKVRQKYFSSGAKNLSNNCQLKNNDQNLSRQITPNEIEAVIKILPTVQSPGPMASQVNFPRHAEKS